MTLKTTEHHSSPHMEKTRQNVLAGPMPQAPFTGVQSGLREVMWLTRGTELVGGKGRLTSRSAGHRP